MRTATYSSRSHWVWALASAALLGGVAELAYLFVADRLDRLGVGHTAANLGGLATDVALDFIGQSYVFLGCVHLRNMNRFLLYRVADTILRHGLYEIVRNIPAVRRYLQQTEAGGGDRSAGVKNGRRRRSFLKSHETHLRYFVTVASFLISYPLRRYWVFV